MTFGIPPRTVNPLMYAGENMSLIPAMNVPRAPRVTDVNYPLFTVWRNSNKNAVAPDAEGDLWILVRFDTVPDPMEAVWIKMMTGTGTLLTLSDSVGTLIDPDADGNIQVLGAGVAQSSTPVSTLNTGPSEITVLVQYATTSASTDATKSGIVHFNSAQFTVDANGFVSLTGGGAAVDSLGVDAASGTGTDPVTPNGSGIIELTGAQVATGTVGTNVVRTHSTTANSVTVEIQRSTSAASSTVASNGVSHYDSDHFDVDSNAWVQIKNFVEPTSWTPAISTSVAGTITYAIQAGRYARIGPLVIASFELSWTGIGTSSGDITITGFPVTIGGALNRNPLGQIWVENLAFPAGVLYNVLWGQSGSTSAAIYGIKDAGIPSLLQIGANATLHGTLCYWTSI